MRAPHRRFRILLACGLVVACTQAMAQLPPLAAPQGSAPGGLPSLPSGPQSQPLAPVSPGAQTKTILAVTAYFSEGQAIAEGVKWRVFSDQSDVNGNYPLIAESDSAKHLFPLDPGGYVVHATYGLAAKTEHVVLGSTAASVDMVLPAGGLRLSGVINEREIERDDLTFQVISVEGGIEHTVLEEAKTGQIIRLAAGDYQIVSTYGNANARIQVDLAVEPGKLTDATLNHKAATVRLRLRRPGSDASLTDATWSILTPGGDPVTTLTGGLTDAILAEGDYIAVVQYEGQNLQREFTVRSGDTTEIALSLK